MPCSRLTRRPSQSVVGHGPSHALHPPTHLHPPPSQEVDASSWRVLTPRVRLQQNGCDCGVFACLFANRVALGRGFDFRQVGGREGVGWGSCGGGGGWGGINPVGWGTDWGGGLGMAEATGAGPPVFVVTTATAPPRTPHPHPHPTLHPRRRTCGCGAACAWPTSCSSAASSTHTRGRDPAGRAFDPAFDCTGFDPTL